MIGELLSWCGGPGEFLGFFGLIAIQFVLVPLFDDLTHTLERVVLGRAGYLLLVKRNGLQYAGLRGSLLCETYGFGSQPAIVLGWGWNLLFLPLELINIRNLLLFSDPHAIFLGPVFDFAVLGGTSLALPAENIVEVGLFGCRFSNVD